MVLVYSNFLNCLLDYCHWYLHIWFKEPRLSDSLSRIQTHDGVPPEIQVILVALFKQKN